MAEIDDRPPVRINTKISARANDWLDRKSKEMALSKSALVNIAVENYIKESEVVHGLPRVLQELQKQGIRVDL